MRLKAHFCMFIKNRLCHLNDKVISNENGSVQSLICGVEEMIKIWLTI